MRGHEVPQRDAKYRRTNDRAGKYEDEFASGKKTNDRGNDQIELFLDGQRPQRSEPRRS
jgi:hypothetical protein